MRTYINIRRKKTIWRKLHQYSGLLLFSLILTACSQGSDPQQGVISDDKLNAPLPKAIATLLTNNAKLIVHVVVNGDTGNPFRVENLVANTTAGTFSGNVPGFSAGIYTLSLVYSINDPAQGTIEIIKTSDITVTVVANENTPANFSSAEMIYTDTDGDSFSNLDELKAGTSIIISNYTVGGQVEGLTGTGLILQNNGSDNLAISADSTFSFSLTAIDGDEYAVSVLAQPGNPDQICTVNNGNGRISDIVVSNVTVICSTTSYTVGGTVSGYTGSGLVLQNNDGDDLPVSANGVFSFSSALADGSGYAVSVRTQPGSLNQVCTVNNGHGTVSGATVSSVVIICSADSYTVGGTVSGYDGSGLVLQNNSSDNLIINVEGNFTFSSAVANGSNYTVTVLTQPGSLNQVCTVSNGSGTVDSAPVSGVSVICNTAPTATSVTISDDNGGSTVPGNGLSGSYTYTDAESDTEDASTFRWMADGVAIAGATTASYVPVPGDTDKTITFEVTPVATAGVTTGVAASSAGLVIVENSPPFFTSGIAISVTEDIVVTGYTATALDPDGDTVTFSLSDGGGTDQAVFSIDNDSGVLSFNISTRFKTPADSDDNNTYVVEITATDGIDSTVRSVTVTVTKAILEVNVTADIKTIRFEWPVYVDATSYKMFVNPDGVSGFDSLQDSFSETSITITLPVHLTDWINARYILEAYDALGNELTESSPVSIASVMLSSIGYFKASNTGAGDQFGGAISLSADGNTLAVGGRWEDSFATGVSTGGSGEGDNTASNSGAVYVFSRNSNIWEQQAYIKVSNTGAGDLFGGAVSLSGDGNTLVVGAYFEDSVATGISIDGSGEGDNTAGSSGAAYVFSRKGGIWSQQAYVKASNAGEDDWFGYAVSLSGDGSTLVVGAIQENSRAIGVSIDGSGEGDNTAGSSGAVYVFSRNGDTWVQQAYVKASNTDANDYFGYAVNLSRDGNTLAVGAVREGSGATGVSTDGSGEDDNTASYSGAVYVFSRNGDTWAQQAYVKASNTGTDDRFGNAVSLSGDGNMLAVGARWEDSVATGISTDGSGEDDNMASSSGAVYVFSPNGDTWVQQAYVKASNTGVNDLFGRAVSLSGDGNMLAVGASQADRVGTVYVFSHSGGVWSQQSYVEASNTGRDDWFGSVVSLSADGNMLAVGAPGEESVTTGISTGGNISNSASRAGAVYLY